MNIFVLSKNPKTCAKLHCDKHVVKMILESCQMLSTCQDYYGIKPIYKPTHINHPCNVWVRESRSNYIWLCDLTYYLLKEYEYRYNKKHKCEKVLKYCFENIPNFKFYKMTPFRMAMPEKYKCNNVVKAYRNYYIGEKLQFCKWTKRDVPTFINKHIFNKNEQNKI